MLYYVKDPEATVSFFQSLLDKNGKLLIILVSCKKMKRLFLFAFFFTSRPLWGSVHKPRRYGVVVTQGAINRGGRRLYFICILIRIIVKSHALLFVYFLLYFEILFSVFSVFSFSSFYLIIFTCFQHLMCFTCVLLSALRLNVLTCVHCPGASLVPDLHLSLLGHFFDEKLKSHEKSKVNN